MPLAALLFATCTRRELTDDYKETALAPVRIDWSKSGVPTNKMHRASVLLYPVDGSHPLEYRLEGDLEYREIAVPIGVYSVVVFNETLDADDWEGLEFNGAGRYETFAAMATADTVRGFYRRSPTLPLVKDPEPLAAWSLDRFEVTRQMALKTREIARKPGYRPALEREVPELTSVTPQPRFERVVVTARATNLASSMQATGTLDGMAGGVYMVSGERIPTPSTHAFILNGRVYDANQKDGTTTRTFNIFGRMPGQTARYGMDLDFLLVDGTLHSRETFDVTGIMRYQQGATVPTAIINVGFDSRKITLPDLNAASTISVDGWDEIAIPLQ